MEHTMNDISMFYICEVDISSQISNISHIIKHAHGKIKLSLFGSLE